MSLYNRPLPHGLICFSTVDVRRRGGDSKGQYGTVARQMCLGVESSFSVSPNETTGYDQMRCRWDGCR